MERRVWLDKRFPRQDSAAGGTFQKGTGMNRIINNPDEVVEDALRGYLRAHADLLAGTDNPRVLRHPSAPRRGKVGIVTGGGSGHEPAFLGYVGENMVDAVAKRDVPVIQACGLVFATVFVTLNTLADILAMLANPRLRNRNR